MRILKHFIALIAAAALSCVSVYAHTAKIAVSGENDYKAAELVPAVYNNANADLSDLRLTDEQGRAAPFFLYNAATEQTQTPDVNYLLSAFDAFRMGDDSVYDFYFPGGDITRDIEATSIKLAG